MGARGLSYGSIVAGMPLAAGCGRACHGRASRLAARRRDGRGPASFSPT